MSVKGPGSTIHFDGSSHRVLVVHARWNSTVIDALVEGTLRKLRESGVKPENIVVKSVPGSFELPFAVKQLIAGAQTQSSQSGPSLMEASANNLVNLLDASGGGGANTTDPAAAGAAVTTGPFTSAIAIGTLIKGSTMHFEYICDSVSHALMRVGLDSGIPVIFGVLTCLTDDQALERAGLGRGENGKGHNHGEDWGLAAVELGAQNIEWSKGKI